MTAPTSTLGSPQRIWGRLWQRRTLLFFSGSSVVASTAHLLAGMLVFRWVPPERIGVWQSVLVLAAWLEVVKLGTLNGMNRQLPFLMGKGEAEQAGKVASTAQGFMLWSLVLGLLAFLGFLAAAWSRGPDWRLSVAGVGLCWCGNYYSSYVQATFRAATDFDRLSRIQIFEGVLSLALLLVVWYWGFWGFAIRAVLQVSVMAAVLHCVRPMRVPCSFDFAVLRSLLAFGFPLFVASYLFQIANGAERSALLSRGTEKLVGLYAPAVAVQTAMLMLPNSLLVYLYPKLSFKFGKTADPRVLWAGTLKATCGAVAVSVLLAVAGWFALPWVLPRILPAYRDSVPAMQWSLISGIFLAVRPASALFPALMAWRFHCLWVGVFVVAKWVFAFAFVSHVDPLAGVAFGGMLAALLSAIAILWGAYRATHGAAGPVAASVDEPVS